jgi:hypothetical protein
VIRSAVLALVVLSLPLAARAGEASERVDDDRAFGLSRADLFSTVDTSTLIEALPVPELMDGRRFPVSSPIGQMGMAPLDLFPAAFLHPVEVRPAKGRRTFETDASDAIAELRSTPIYTGGEVGVFYGRSTGKYGGDVFGSYILGTIATDKFQITAGASYQESNFRFRGGR